MCNLESGVLAGSVLSMDTAIRNMVKFSGCSLFEAVQMASLNPARLLGVDHSKGSIAAGKDADLVVLDNEGNLHKTIVRGQFVYKV
jgi:N-acetylglucosamine-6-phosphate deacetylase